MRLFESNLNGSPRLVLGHDHGLGSIGVRHSLYIFHYTCGQSYKHFTLVNYDSGVVIWGIFQSGMTLES